MKGMIFNNSTSKLTGEMAEYVIYRWEKGREPSLGYIVRKMQTHTFKKSLVTISKATRCLSCYNGSLFLTFAHFLLNSFKNREQLVQRNKRLQYTVPKSHESMRLGAYV